MKQDAIIKKTTLDDNSVLIKKFIKGIEGGRTLYVADYTEDVIPCGTIIASKQVVLSEGASAEKVYFPLAIETAEDGTKSYKALGTDEKYEGLLYSSILTEKPAAAIMTWGIVNEEALPCAVPTAFKTALAHIDYQTDEEA